MAATYRRDGAIGVITMDDGKANVLGPAMQAALGAALDEAAADDVVVVLEGRVGRFSGGFDLAVLTGGGADAATMVRGGFELAARLLTWPRPVVIACTGHAVAMGAFLLLAGDRRVGAEGPFTIRANEVAIGLTMPRAALALGRMRLTPAHLHRSMVTAEEYDPAGAVVAGHLDELVDPADVGTRARAVANELATLDPAAYRSTKVRLQGAAVDALWAAIEEDDADLQALLG